MGRRLADSKAGRDGVTVPPGAWCRRPAGVSQPEPAPARLAAAGRRQRS